jgi:hypothetical protein
LDSLRILAPTIKQKYIDAVCSSASKPIDGPAGAVDFDELEKILEARGISVIICLDVKYRFACIFIVNVYSSELWG